MSDILHERIRLDFERAILSGDLAPGQRLPTEAALMMRYGCSRMTVSKGLSALAAAGLIERRRKAGTFVARPRAHAMVLDIPDLAAEVAGRGQDYRYRALARRLHATGIATSLACAGAALELDGVHEADGRAFAAEYRMVAVAAAPGIEAADFAASSPGSWLLAHVPWTEAETRIRAVAAGEDGATLGISAGEPCLCLERRTWRGAAAVTVVRQVFPADAYELVARFGPGATT